MELPAKFDAFWCLFILPSRIWQLQNMVALQFVAEFFFTGQNQAVFGGEELLALAEDGVADEGVALGGAEEFIPAMV